MENNLERKYGLVTAISMVVGIIIGSGVFFKAQTILTKTGGNMPLGIIAWIIGGAIMIACILAFASMAQRYEKVNGIVDYAEATVGSRYAYYIGWFIAVIYSPTLTMALAWLSARYTLVFITSINPDFPLLISAAEGGCATGPECMILSLLFLCCAYAINALSPKLAGKVQVSTTVIKLIPLVLMAVVGIIYGLMNGTLTRNFTAAAEIGGVSGSPLLSAVCATSFAYEGWIIATSINSELKDAKKNLPRALIVGGIIVIIVYIAYYIGVAGGASNQELIDKGATVAFTNIFGAVLGNILNLFIAISCVGTMNGLMLGCTRGIYSLALRGQGPHPRMFSRVDSATGMAGNSAILGLVLCAFWLVYFAFSNLFRTWTGAFIFDPTELPIITLYALYIPIFICWMKKAGDEPPLKRFVIPLAAICGSLFMMYACYAAHGIGCLWYLIVFAVVMLAGAFANRGKRAQA